MNSNYPDESFFKAYLSTNHYKQKNFIQDQKGQGLENTMTIQITQQQAQSTNQPKSLPNKDQSVSNNNQQLQQEVDNNIQVSINMNQKPIHEISYFELERIERRQIIENMYQKKAQVHAYENFLKFKEVYGENIIESYTNFNKFCFTYDSVVEIKNLSGGVTPKKIYDIKSNQKDYEFFNSNVNVVPERLEFGDTYINIAVMEIIRISNTNKKAKLVVNEILSSTPEISFYFQENSRFTTFPITLNPEESIDIRVVILPETFGKFESLIYILFQDKILVKQIQFGVITNLYDIRPIYYTDVSASTSYESPLDIMNFMPDEYLKIEDIEPNEDFIQLKWPNGLKAVIPKTDTDSQNASYQNNSQYLMIPPDSTKTFIKIVFRISETGDQSAAIKLKTNLQDIVRIPLYFHIINDPLKFYPTIADFGILQKNFNLVKINVKMQIKQKESIYITDIYVPIDERRLDFQFLQTNPNHNEYYNKKMLNSNTEINLGSITLNPYFSGHVNTQIVITFINVNSNVTKKVAYPIICYIKEPRQSNIDQNISGIFTQLSHATTFDIKEYLSEDQQRNQKFIVTTLHNPLYIINTLEKPIILKEIFNENIDILNIHRTQPDEIIVKPGQKQRVAWVELYTKNLKVTQDTRYFSLILNETLVTLSIAIYDQGLLCSWDDDHNQFTKQFRACDQMKDIQFYYIPQNLTKFRKINITNTNPIDIDIESIRKNSLDDLMIYIEAIYDKRQKIEQYSISQLNKNGDKQESLKQFPIFQSRRSKTFQNLKIKAGYTYTLVILVKSNDVSNKNGKLSFYLKGQDLQPYMAIDYAYTIVQGQLTMLPYQLYFDPAFPGVIQNKSLTAKSTFDQTIVIKSIKCSDPRIQVHQNSNNTIIIPKNKTEIATITFDPSRSLNNNNQQNPQQTFDFSKIFNGQNLQIQFFEQLSSQQQQNLKNIISGLNYQNGQFVFQNPQQMQMQIKQIQEVDGIQKLQQQAQKQFEKLYPLLQLEDVYQWREKQKTWDKLGSLGKTEIKTTLIIETNHIQSIEVPVKAYLSKPQIVVMPEDNVLNFGTVQIGTQVTRSIKIYNPSEEILQISLFLAEDVNFKEIQQGETQQERNSQYQKDIYKMMYQGINGKRKRQEATFNQSSKIEDIFLNKEQDAKNFGEEFSSEKESYMSLYCAQKLKEADIDESIYEKVDESEIFIDFKTDMVILCLNLLDIANINTQQAQELDYDFKKNLEPFFKDLYFAEQSEILKGFSLEQLLSQRNEYGALEKVMKCTVAKPIEILMANAHYQNNPQSLQEIYYSTIQTLKKITQQIFQDYSLRQHEKSIYQNIQPYRLKNPYLHDIIINNSTQLKQDFSQLNSQQQNSQEQQQYQWNTQNFYINPKVQSQLIHYIEPKRNLTISDAVIFYPQSFDKDILSMTLLIRNNLTILYPIELKGSGGTGLIEIVNIIKKTNDFVQEADYRNNSQFENLLKENLNLNYSLKDISGTREKIIQFVFGGQNLNQDSQENDFIYHNNHSKSTSFNNGGYQDKLFKKDNKEIKTIFFSITIEDLLQQTDQDSTTSTFQQFEFQNINNQQLLQEQIINEKSQTIKVNNFHKRILVAQNTGNLPITIDNIYIEGKECSAYGFTIQNCHKFTLQPGETHQIYLSYQTDFSFSHIKKILILESQHFQMEYVLQVQIPINILSLAHKMIPYNKIEESLYYFLTLLLALIGSLIIFYVSRDIIAHLKYIKSKIYHDQQSLLLEQKQIKPIGKKEKMAIPMLKEVAGNEQVVNQYQQCTEKFENQTSLLLKEITNICGKKNMTVLELQKQTQDQKKSQRQMNLARYLEKKEKEENINKNEKGSPNVNQLEFNKQQMKNPSKGSKVDIENKITKDTKTQQKKVNEPQFELIQQKTQQQQTKNEDKRILQNMISNDYSVESGSFKISDGNQSMQNINEENQILEQQQLKKNVSITQKKKQSKQQKKQEKRKEEMERQQQFQKEKEIEEQNRQKSVFKRENQKIEDQNEKKLQKIKIDEEYQTFEQEKQNISHFNIQEAKIQNMISESDDLRNIDLNYVETKINLSTEKLNTLESLQINQETYGEEEPVIVVLEENDSIEKISQEEQEQSFQKEINEQFQERNVLSIIEDDQLNQNEQQNLLSDLQVKNIGADKQYDSNKQMLIGQFQNENELNLSQLDKEYQNDQKSEAQSQSFQQNSKKSYQSVPKQAIIVPGGQQNQNKNYYLKKDQQYSNFYQTKVQSNQNQRKNAPWAKNPYYQSDAEEYKYSQRQGQYQQNLQKRNVNSSLKNQSFQQQSKYKSKTGFQNKNESRQITQEYDDEQNSSQYYSQGQTANPYQQQQYYIKKEKERSFEFDQSINEENNYKREQKLKKKQIDKDSDIQVTQEEQNEQEYKFNYEEESQFQQQQRFNKKESFGLKNEKMDEMEQQEENKFVKEFEDKKQRVIENERFGEDMQQKLSKTELEPFFENQNKDEAKKDESFLQFGFKNMFNQNENQAQMEAENEENSYYEDSQEHQEMTQTEQKSGINFFNVFQSVNSVFSQHNYGHATNIFKQNQDHGEKSSKVFQYQSQNKIEENSDEDMGGSSLFSKNLFGGSSSYFNQAKKEYGMGQNELQKSKEVKKGGFSILDELRKESKPVTNINQSIFGNPFFNASPGQKQQSNWNLKQNDQEYKDDEENDQDYQY